MTTAIGNSNPGAWGAFIPFRRKGGASQARGDVARAKGHPPRFPFLLKGKENRAPIFGFTLIEMLAVIVLLAIGATLTAVSLHGRSRGQLQAAAQGMAAGLRDTRTRAMATGEPQWFTLDLRAHSFTVPGRSPRGLPADATLRATSAATADSQPGIARIGYFPDGSSSGGHIILSARQRVLRVDVDWLTGAVTVNQEVAQ